MDKVVLVTGGASGIGKAIAERFAQGGYDVAFTYSSNDEEAQSTLETLEKYNVKVKKYKFDVSQEQETSENIKEIIEDFGKIDALVNNAGICIDNLLIRISTENIKKVLDVNLYGTINVSKEVVKHMFKKKNGVILNITSVVGEVGNIGQSIYSASKAGVIGFTKSLAKEAILKNIRVNAIAPGFIRTKMTDVLSDEQKEQILSTIPMKRLGEPSEVANLAFFLASDEATYITGQILNVDGGMVI